MSEEILTLAEMVDDFRIHWDTMHKMARRTVEEAHAAGAKLINIKQRLPHGRWMEWLKEEGVHRDMARRLMVVAKIEITQLAQFDTVSDALKSLRPVNETPAIPERTGRPEPRNVTPRQTQSVIVPAGHIEGDLPPPSDDVVPDSKGGYEIAPPSELSPMQAAMLAAQNAADVTQELRGMVEPPANDAEGDATDALMFRAEEAERERDALAVKNRELEDRLAVIEARDSDDSRAADLARETETATQATTRAREELAKSQEIVKRVKANERRLQRQLKGIKQDLMDQKPYRDILVRHYKVAPKEKAGKGNCGE